jgi:CTP synthase (UTP-ammonia lyase)
MQLLGILDYDIVNTEIGGTVGDMVRYPVSQLDGIVGRMIVIHLTLPAPAAG